MGLSLRVSVDSVDDRIRDYGVGAKLYWARDNTSATGTFADATANTILVAGQTAYEVYDATGASGQYYRTRVGNTGATDFSAWSAVFQGGAIEAYATVDDLREEIRLPNDSYDNVLADYLRDASGWLDAVCNRDFYRHPQVTGTETRMYHLPSDAFEINDDIVSITTVEYATTTGRPYVAALATDWVLLPARVSGEPYSAVALSDVGLVSTWYAGYATVRLTGVFGFAAVPRAVRRATLDIARELYQQGVGGRPVGLEFGRLPPSAQATIERYTRHDYAHV